MPKTKYPLAEAANTVRPTRIASMFNVGKRCVLLFMNAGVDHEHEKDRTARRDTHQAHTPQQCREVLLRKMEKCEAIGQLNTNTACHMTSCLSPVVCRFELVQVMRCQATILSHLSPKERERERQRDRERWQAQDQARRSIGRTNVKHDKP